MSGRWAVVHPGFGPRGGGELVGAWVLQALAAEREVMLVTEQRVDWREIDAAFGTTLQTQANLSAQRLPAAWRVSLRAAPGRGHRLRRAVLERFARQLAVQENAMRWISTCDEMRLPHPGFQYVHFPRLPDSGERTKWHRLPGAARVHELVSRALEAGAATSERDHVTWVNSQFTAAAWHRIYGTSCEVIYPPVPPLLRETDLRPWAEREQRVVCVGRIIWWKGLERVLRIVAAARERGASLRLVFAGRWDCGARERREIEQRMREAGAELQVGLAREELGALLATSRYGLHGMNEEPFGIAVAEMQDAGLVVLAPTEGGPAEILGDDRQLYCSDDEASEKLLRICRDDTQQQELHQRALSRRGLFSRERFVGAIRASLMSGRVSRD